MRTSLVLGGGGVVGMAYHAGVLRALELEAGFAPADADLIIGTSAGSVVGAYLRSGWTTEDFWKLAMGTHPRMAAIRPAERMRETDILAPAFRSPLGLVRRGLGSAFVLSRSFARVPVPPVPSLLRHAFPAGIFAMTAGRMRFESELPAAWPSRDLWLTGFDITRGRRVVLGREGSPTVPLPSAVAASCAIPGVYAPVRVGNTVLVDGGVWSPSNLDLAGKAHSDLVVCVAPMAYEPGGRAGMLQLARQWPTRVLQREAAGVRGRGARVLLIRPTAAEVRAHGFNLMRSDAVDQVARAAYEATARSLGTERFKTTLDLLAA